jgi:HAD superfamily hydrolase (TIGR01509 family)
LLTATVFDLDGVLTRTERTHATAWKALFDDFLRSRALALGTAFVPFDPVADYRAHVDGRPRRDGVRTFAASRGIQLPEGTPADAPGEHTVHGLAKMKDRSFMESVERLGVEVDRAAIGLARALRARTVRIGVASSSRNCVPILNRAGIFELFDAVVDGIDIGRLGLAGKPAPDLFIECLHRLGADDPSNAAVVEDAAAGVAAGRAGNFGLVIGVDRGENRERLLANGADWVVSDLSDVTPERMDQRLREVAFARRGSGTAPPRGLSSPFPLDRRRAHLSKPRR